MSLKKSIKTVLSRTSKGYTVAEINRKLASGASYASIRGRVYEMANAGELREYGQRKDPVTGKYATVFMTEGHYFRNLDRSWGF